MRIPALLLFILLVAATLPVLAQEKPGEPFMVEGTTSPVISVPKAIYPASGKKAGIEGVVRVRATIDESGKVISVTVVSGLEQPEFRESAITAAKQATFHPLIRDGKAIQIIRTLEYNFELIDDPIDPKMMPMMVGVVVKVFKAFSNDLDLIPKDLFSDFPEPAGDSTEPFEKLLFEMVSRFPKIEPQERRALAEKTAAELMKVAKSDQQWMLKAGLHFGAAVGPVFLLRSKEERAAFSSVDVVVFKKDLAELLEMCKQPPKDIDPDLLESFRRVAELSKIENPFSDDHLEDTINRIGASFEKVFDFDDES